MLSCVSDVNHYIPCNQESRSDLFDIQSDCISILWGVSCDSAYFTDTFQPATTVTNLTQLLRNEISKLDSVLIDSYTYRGAAHIISNIAVSDVIKMEIAGTWTMDNYHNWTMDKLMHSDILQLDTFYTYHSLP